MAKSKTLDNFQVVGELGRGASSRILHVRDPKSFQHFAMKVVVKENADEQKFLEQAKHEYVVAQQLDHPNIVKIFDIRVKSKWFREREVRTLIEYVNGGTLEDVQGLPVGALAIVFRYVAQAVGYMHRRNVYHADIKPNNILLTQSGQVKVIDFGLAWFRGQSKDRVQGTMGYLAPEQITEKTVTPRTDIYNLGITMYRVFSNQKSLGTPRGETVIPASGFLRTAHEMNPEVPEKLSDLISQCCHRRPGERPKNMATIEKKLAQFAKALNVSEDDLPNLIRIMQRGT